MKKLTTYCFLLIGGLNVLFVHYLSVVSANYGVTVRDKFLDGLPLPWFTEMVLQCSWWPWVGVAICVAGAVLSLLGKPKDNVLRDLLTVLLIVELGIMFLSVIAFNLPWVWQRLK